MEETRKVLTIGDEPVRGVDEERIRGRGREESRAIRCSCGDGARQVCRRGRVFQV